MLEQQFTVFHLKQLHGVDGLGAVQRGRRTVAGQVVDCAVTFHGFVMETRFLDTLVPSIFGTQQRILKIFGPRCQWVQIARHAETVQYIVICGRQELGIVVGFDLDHEISHFTKRITTESLISWTEIYFTILPFFHSRDGCKR